MGLTNIPRLGAKIKIIEITKLKRIKTGKFCGKKFQTKISQGVQKFVLSAESFLNFVVTLTYLRLFKDQLVPQILYHSVNKVSASISSNIFISWHGDVQFISFSFSIQLRKFYYRKGQSTTQIKSTTLKGSKKREKHKCKKRVVQKNLGLILPSYCCIA